MTRKTISVTSDQPVSVTSDLPVSIEVRGDTVTVSIEDMLPSPNGLARSEPEPAGQGPPDEDKQVVNQTPRCDVLMPRSGQLCKRRRGHNGVHMSARQIARKQDYNKKRARERYQNDPEYAERIKEKVRQRGVTTE
jgi:hypothetical protein